MSELEKRLKQIVADYCGLPMSDLDTQDSFSDDLGLDSLDIVELVMTLEEEFECEIPDEQADQILTIQDMLDYLHAHVQVSDIVDETLFS